MKRSGFAWIDLEESGDRGLRQISEDLDLGAETVETLVRADRRPSFKATPDATYAAAPVADSAGPVQVSTHFPYVCLALTDRFLLTRHTEPCPALVDARDSYTSLPEDAKTDGAVVLFLVLDSLVRNLEPLLLSIDERLSEIQMVLMTSSPPEIHDEILDTMRILTTTVQGLTWYYSDLDEAAGELEHMPGMHAGSLEPFGRHRERVVRMRASAQGYRERAKETFDQYASNSSDRQGQLINVLTVVATLFLPLTFLTGFFGMNFGVIVNDLNSVWAFVLLGVMLPAASVATFFILYHRLLRRFGVGNPNSASNVSERT